MTTQHAVIRHAEELTVFWVVGYSKTWNGGSVKSRTRWERLPLDTAQVHTASRWRPFQEREMKLGEN